MTKHRHLVGAFISEPVLRRVPRRLNGAAVSPMRAMAGAFPPGNARTSPASHPAASGSEAQPASERISAAAHRRAATLARGRLAPPRGSGRIMFMTRRLSFLVLAWCVGCNGNKAAPESAPAPEPVVEPAPAPEPASESAPTPEPVVAPAPAPATDGELKTCGGFAAIDCEAGFTCVDDPRDSCDPATGGADCGGVCRPCDDEALGGPTSPGTSRNARPSTSSAGESDPVHR